MGLLKSALLFRAGRAVFDQVSRRRAAGGAAGNASGHAASRGGPRRRGGLGELIRSFTGGGRV